MAQSPIPIHYQISDYEQWQGDWELIDGIPVAMTPAPVIAHQLIATRMLTELTNSLEPCETCLAIAEAEWRIGDDTVFRPDGVVICYPPGNYLDKPPVLILEVLSPSTARLDREYKKARYAQECVKHYLLADPATRRVEAFILGDGQYEKREETTSTTLEFDLGPCTARIDCERVFSRL